MFRTLYESFEDPNIQDLNNEIVRYQSLEPNYTILTNQNLYQFPNAGQQSSNTGLQGALNQLGTVPVPGTTRDQKESTDITNLSQVLTGIPDSLARNLKECRKYEGLVGLSNLIKNQANPGAAERCGWRYKPGIGAIPETAQAAYGNSSGPLDPANPRVDRIGNGTNYIWNLQEAEKTMIKDVCKAATNCVDMTAVPISAAGDFSNLCGYCETSKKIIPIKTVNGTVVARYNDLDGQCASEKIITMKDAKERCPVPPPGAPQPGYMKCLNTGKLDRDCVTMSALFAGCSPEGTLVSALTKGKNDQDYADLLRKQKSFETYQQLSQTPLSENVLRSGDATIFAAFMNNYNLNRNMYNSDNEKRWVAALDLCRYGGIYDQWNFCNDLKDGDKDFELKCMQQAFLQNGGSTEGSDFPRSDTYQQLKGSMNWGQYKDSIKKLVEAANSRDPSIQTDALNRMNGLNIRYNPTNFPRGEAGQGVEVFYFDLARNTFLGRRPYQSAAGKTLPNFNVGGGVVEETGLVDNVQMVYIYDMRPDNDVQVSFGAITDDGWALSRNQSVFNIKDWSNGASWWYNQAPTWHNTSAFAITAENRNQPNIFMGAWYEAGGGAAFHPFYKIGPTVYDRQGQAGWVQMGGGRAAIDTFWKNNCYFTQEIDAPTLQFEPYQPRGAPTAGLHFMDRRLWGSSQLRETEWNKTAIQKGHLFSKPAQTPLPANQMVLTLEDTRQWSIAGSIAASAIRTWVICFNIATMKKGRSFLYGDLCYFMNAMGGAREWAVRAYDSGSPDYVNLSLAYKGTRGAMETDRIRVLQNKWYICAVSLHPENMSSRAIGKMTMFVQTLQNVKDGKVMDNVRLLEINTGNEGQLFNDIARDRRDAGRLVLGTVHPNEQKKFQYAWVHGFDSVITPDDVTSWKKEATKTWQGRWFD
jgi:hypothetical protein